MGTRLRVSRGLALAAALACGGGPTPGRAQAFGADALPFAVHIEQTPKQSWPGYGVYLGDGYVITAAHVAGHALITAPKIVIDGRPYPTTVVKEGTFETNDLTLLRTDPAGLPGKLQLRRLSLCPAPKAGQAVIVATPEFAAPSHVLSPEQLPPTVRARFSTAIADVATTGNSGSGVFDAWSGCLMGIISRKITQTSVQRPGLPPVSRDIAKYFVPPSVIAAFLPKDAQF